MQMLAAAIAIGAGATAVMDGWSWLRRRLFGLAPPDFGLVGRWLAHMPRGRFRHASIAAAAPMPHERLLGWSAHYLTGIVFAALLLAAWGAPWLRAPTLPPALAVGVATVAAPFLLMQPGMGAGLAARLAPRPGAVRFHSLVNHAVFGLGLYVSALAFRALSGP